MAAVPPGVSWVARHLSTLCGATASAAALVAVLVATRDQPMMSPDSVTYLAAAEHIRSLDGIRDLTGLPLTVFPPVYPFLLAPGGASLGWARVIGALALATAAWFLFVLVRRRGGTPPALVAALALGLSPGLIRVASTVWSETPYLAISAATLAVLCVPSVTRRAAIVGGLLASAGFLTRYAGAGLVATAAVVVILATWSRADRWVVRGAFVAAVAVPVLAWVVRNTMLTGQPLGPRFEGGSRDSLSVLVRRPVVAIGELLGGRGTGRDTRSTIGWIVVWLTVAAVVALGAVLARRLLARRPPDTALVTDVAVAGFALTGVVLPVLARMATSNDIEYRVMSPMVLPVVYAAAVTTWRLGARLGQRRGVWAFAAVAVVGGGPWVLRGLRDAGDFPGGVTASLNNRSQFSIPLYDAVERLPPSATVMTNNPHRVWWFNRREPTYFGFTRPRPGNSVYPRSPADTVALACRPDAYLAWFIRPGDPPSDPFTMRPDLAALVHLQLVQQMNNGMLYRMSVDRDRCPAQR